MSALFTADTHWHLTGRFLTLTVGKIDSLGVMSLFSEHIKWKHAQPKVAGPFLLPIASFLNGVKNTHRKRQDRQLCPVWGRAKRSESIDCFLS